MTLFDILKNAYLALGQMEVSTATGGSTTTAVDSKLLDYGDDDLVGSALFILETGDGASPAGEVQRISANTSSGTLTVDTAFGAAIQAGDVIGIAKNVYPLRTMIELVNRALANLGTLQLTDVSIVTSDDAESYDLPLALKRKVVRVQISIADGSDWVDVPGWTIVPSAAGSAGAINFPFDLPGGRTLKIWYEAEHPRLSAMSDPLAETIHSELATALVVEKALQWQNDRQSGQDAYMLQRLNKAMSDAENMRMRFAPQKVRLVKTLGLLYDSSIGDDRPCRLA